MLASRFPNPHTNFVAHFPPLPSDAFSRELRNLEGRVSCRGVVVSIVDSFGAVRYLQN